MASKTPEKKVQDKIISYLDSIHKSGASPHLEWFRRDAIGPNYKRGLPDIWVLVNGRHIEIEVKAPGKSRTAMQIKWEERFRLCRIPYMVVDSFDKFVELFSPFLK